MGKVYGVLSTKEELLEYLGENIDALTPVLENRIRAYRKDSELRVINPARLGRYFGITCVFVDLPEDQANLYGYSIIRQKHTEKEVCISRHISDKNKRLGMAYEVLLMLLIPGATKVPGDIVLNRYSAPDSLVLPENVEKTIKKYAMDILVPADVFEEELNTARKIPGEYNTDFDVVGYLSDRFGVPRFLVEEKLKNFDEKM